MNRLFVNRDCQKSTHPTGLRYPSQRRQMGKISRGHAEGVDDAQFELGNFVDLPLKDDSVDFIVSTGSSHHWRKSAKAFDECYRVLKAGREAWIYDGYPDMHSTPNPTE